MKADLKGMLNRKGSKFPSGYRAHMGGYVVSGQNDGSVGWNELADASGNILANNPIDQAITEIRSYNSAHGASQLLKVRIALGINTAPYALNLGGPSFLVTDPQDGSSGQCPVFWNQTFRDAWRAFEQKLCAQYDAVPEIAEILCPRSVTIYCEPMIRQIHDAPTVAALIAAGYTLQVDEINQQDDPRFSSGGDAVTGFAGWNTRVGYTYNPYEKINPTGVDVNEAISILQGNQFIAAPGHHLSMENNSLRESYLSGTGDYQRLYAAMLPIKNPYCTIGFQTATLARVGNVYNTVQGAVQQLGASHVEMPPGFEASLTVAQATTLAAMF